MPADPRCSLSLPRSRGGTSPARELVRVRRRWQAPNLFHLAHPRQHRLIPFGDRSRFLLVEVLDDESVRAVLGDKGIWRHPSLHTADVFVGNMGTVVHDVRVVGGLQAVALIWIL